MPHMTLASKKQDATSATGDPNGQGPCATVIKGVAPTSAPAVGFSHGMHEVELPTSDSDSEMQHAQTDWIAGRSNVSSLLQVLHRHL